MADTFRYAAFICHADADERFAQRLGRMLESRAAPVAFGQFSGPDDERVDEAALKDSGALIVVCSPSAPAHARMQKEIAFFLGLGRRSRVFAIVTETAPLRPKEGRESALAYVPEVLRAEGVATGTALIAGDARKRVDGFRRASLALFGRLMGIAPQELRRRQPRTGRLSMAVAGAAGLAVAAGLGAAWFDSQTWRSRLSAYAEGLAGQGRTLEALPFALASVPARGSWIATSSDRADATLSRTGSVRVGRDIASVGAFALSDNGAILGVQSKDGATGAYYDFSRGGVKHDLGRIHVFALAGDGSALVVQARNRNVVHYDLAQGGKHRVIGRFGVVRRGDLLLSRNGAVVVIEGGFRKPTSYYDLARGAGWRDLEGDATGVASATLSDNGGSLILDLHRQGLFFYDLARGGARYQLAADDSQDPMMLSENGAVLIARSGAMLSTSMTLFDLTRGGARRDLGPVDYGDRVALSTDGAALVVQNKGGKTTFYAPVRGVEHDLGFLSKFALSADGGKLVISTADGATAHYDLAHGGAQRLIGDLRDFHLFCEWRLAGRPHSRGPLGALRSRERHAPARDRGCR